MTQSEAEMLLAQLSEQYGTKPFDPALDLTIRQVANELGMAEQAARDLMNKQVEAGLMTVRHVTMNGRRIKVYRKNG
jgi:predicted ArsR family transcriptional regulator